MNRLTILVGEFGSGKTEFAINYSLYLKKQGLKTAIVDIDLVKPYYRTRENADFLNQHGIIVVAPEKRLAHADLPVLPSEFTRYISDEECHVVADVGGGEASIVLRQFKESILPLNPEVLMVINTKRPFTNDIQGILSTKSRIEQASGLTITGFVSNTNLGSETTEEDMRQGCAKVIEAANLVSLEIKYILIPEWLQEKVNTDKYPAPLFYLRPYTKYPWMD